MSHPTVIHPAGRNQGFTLIEMMVAVAIATVIGLIVTTTYQAALVGGMRADAVAEQNDQARIALALMTRDISSAGFLMGQNATNGGVCSSILTYNSADAANNGMTDLFAIQAVDENGQNPLPNTNITPAAFPSQNLSAEALTVTFNDGSGIDAGIGASTTGVTKVTNGTLQSASLFVTDSSQLANDDLSLIAIPGIKSCIRFQITDIQTNNGGGQGSVGSLVIHNSGQSPLNPSKGFEYFNQFLNPQITTSLLTRAYLIKAGVPGTADGMKSVSYSLRNVAGVPTLFRTVSSFDGTVLQDYAVANGVALMRFVFAPRGANGALGAFVPWSTIVANNQQTDVGAVTVALLMQRKNYGNRGGTPASIAVLGTGYPTQPGLEYQLVTKTVYLTNRGLDR